MSHEITLFLAFVILASPVLGWVSVASLAVSAITYVILKEQTHKHATSQAQQTADIKALTDRLDEIVSLSTRLDRCEDELRKAQIRTSFK